MPVPSELPSPFIQLLAAHISASGNISTLSSLNRCNRRLKAETLRALWSTFDPTPTFDLMGWVQNVSPATRALVRQVILQPAGPPLATDNHRHSRYTPIERHALLSLFPNCQTFVVVFHPRPSDRTTRLHLLRLDASSALPSLRGLHSPASVWYHYAAEEDEDDIHDVECSPPYVKAEQILNTAIGPWKPQAQVILDLETPTFSLGQLIRWVGLTIPQTIILEIRCAVTDRRFPSITEVMLSATASLQALPNLVHLSYRFLSSRSPPLISSSLTHHICATAALSPRFWKLEIRFVPAPEVPQAGAVARRAGLDSVWSLRVERDVDGAFAGATRVWGGRCLEEGWVEEDRLYPTKVME